MSPKKLTDLTDQELLQEARKRKSTAIINALFIGFSVGIIVYSFMKNSLGLLTLIPLFIVYKLVNKSMYV
jgi:hypothetical protein